jgi:hypothetical protein
VERVVAAVGQKWQSMPNKLHCNTEYELTTWKLSSVPEFCIDVTWDVNPLNSKY